MTKYILILLLLIMSYLPTNGENEKIKLGVAGLTHSHVHGLLSQLDHKAFTLVGIAEPNKKLAESYARRYGFSMDLVYSNLADMIEETNPEAVAAFNSIYEHLEVVEICAPKGIHVMVEKPLAVNMEHAAKMEKLAKENSIHLITNYETTWYPTNHKAFELLQEGRIGDIRKVIIRDGHRGPKKIGVNPEFLEWLIDPKLNGGGAIIDFGCYGVNLMTWLMQGELPISVTSVTQQLQPENNPKVDDEANIILVYDQANALVEASWNWPMGRKDMEIYGVSGAIYADNKHDLRIRIAEGYSDFEENSMKLDNRDSPYDDPFSFFAAVINNKIKLQPYDLSSLENNMIVVKILDAAKKSAAEKRTINIY